MPPNQETQPSGVLFEQDVQTDDGGLYKVTENIEPKKTETTLIWFNISTFIFMHAAGLYGLYLAFTEAKWQTNIFAYICYLLSGIAITAGVHRLWSHRSYSAKWPLRVFLMILNSHVFQGSIYYWARDHRVHHKYSETEADPHNSNRGFFYSHVGWLLYKKNHETITKGRQIDLSDLRNDPIVTFQRKYYTPLVIIWCFLIPMLIPMHFWNETLINSYFSVMLRYTVVLNCTWAVNSFAHLYGNQPYDKKMNPRENRGVALMAFGEGFHNYHHAFPWDYKTSELPFYTLPNPATAFIDLMAWLGLAYNLKSVSKKVVVTRALRTGDGTHKLWGWYDPDMKGDEKKITNILNKA